MINLIISIVQIALQILTSQLGGNNQSANVAQSLVDIVNKAMQAYQQQTGKPIDPDLIKPYEPI